MKRNIFLVIVFSFVLVLVLTACSSGSTQSGGASTTSSSGSSTTIDAKALVESKCITCHSLDRISSAKMSESEWASTVNRMTKKGNIDFSADEKAAIAKYLADTYK